MVEKADGVTYSIYRLDLFFLYESVLGVRGNLFQNLSSSQFRIILASSHELSVASLRLMAMLSHQRILPYCPPWKTSL